MAALERGLADLAAQLSAERSTAAANMGPITDQFSERLTALERRLDEAVEHVKGREASQRSEFLTRLEDLQNAIRSDQANVEQTSADLSTTREDMGRSQDELQRGLADLAARVEQLHRSYDAGPASAQSDSTKLASLQGTLARAEAQLNERVDRLADGVLTHRSDILTTLDARLGEVETALARSAQALTGKEEHGRARDELRRDIDGLTERIQGLRAGLDALAGQIGTQSAAHERAQQELARLNEQLNERLDRLAERAHRAAGSVGQALDLLEVLDAGFGELRSGLQELRGAVDVVPVKAVTRASQSAALAPLRADIAAVREDLASHEQALAKLSRSVETLKRKVRPAAPPALPTPRKKKA